MQHITENIFKIEVPLPKNPLKNLNCYVIRDPERSLIIDTGFNLPECREALFRGLEELGVELDRADVFLTHMHSDHAGLAAELQREGTKVFIHETDMPYLVVESLPEFWSNCDAAYSREGFPQQLLDKLSFKNPARALISDSTCRFTTVHNGDILKYGGHELECVHTGGHTPGHTCLYISSLKLMFLGDHVLFDITPNITAWDIRENSLKDYCDNLVRMKSFDVKLPLPAHRGVDIDMYTRIDRILEHHEHRLEEALAAVSSHPGLTAYEIAPLMTWQIRAADWSAFPVVQKWFAVGEVMSHMDWLRLEGSVERRLENGLHRYYPAR